MRYVVFGSGGLAKEMIGYLLDDGHEIVCVVSSEQFGGEAFKYPVVPRLDHVEDGIRYLLAVSDPATKRKIVSENEDRWDSYFHSSCFVSRHSRIGRGSILAPQSIVAGDAELGNFVFFNTNATVGHDATIGHYSTLMPNSEVCGECVVGEDVMVGIGAYVLPGRRVGDGGKVSAGAIVRNNVQEKETVYGDPAKPRS